MSVVEVPFKAEGPVPLMREPPPPPPFPVHALGPLRSAAVAVQDISQAPIGIAAQSALSVASLAVQGFADVETLGGDAPCSLFCMTIALSGERKSTCDRLLMRGVLEHKRRVGEFYSAEMVSYETANKIWSEKWKRLTAEAAGSNAEKAEAAKLELEEMGSAPRQPLSPNITAGDPTLEGLLKLYSIGRPSLGVFTDEGGGFIGGHAMNADNRLKTMAGLSKLWNGEEVDRTRAGDGVQTFRGRRLASHLMMQPIVARPLLSDPAASGQGFLARFLMTEPPSSIGTRLRRGHSVESDREIERFSQHLQRILSEPLPTEEGFPQELTPRRLSLSRDANELLWEFHAHVEKAQAKGEEYDRITAFASKAVEQAARIAGVLTLWQDVNAGEVPLEAMACGIDLAQYYLDEAKRLMDLAVITPETAAAELLRDWLVHTWKHLHIIPSEIVQSGPGSLRETAVVKATLKTLERHGWVARMPEGSVVRGKPRKEAYRIEGKIHAV